MTTFITLSIPSPPDPSPTPSALPSPPTSPRAATARMRIKVPQRPGSLGDLPFTTSPTDQANILSPSLSRVTSATDTPSAHNKASATRSARMATGERRKPSITYYTPASPSLWTQRPHLGRTMPFSVEVPRDAEMNGKENVSQRSSLVLGSRSHSTRESVCSLDGMVAREPLTLVEKHADLLHFIAQKERKCLELRDQLAAHDKELAELKRKWERIVNRGYDPQSQAQPQFQPSAAIATGLGGIKESVRMIAAGFSPGGDGVIPKPKPNPKSPTPHQVNGAPHVCLKSTASQHLSTSSITSIREETPSSDRDRSWDHPMDGEETMIATAPSSSFSLSRAGSLNCRIHKRASRVMAELDLEPLMTTACTTAVGPPVPAEGQHLHLSPKAETKPLPESKLLNLDVGMSLVLAPSPTLVPPLSASASATSGKTTGTGTGTGAPKSPVLGSTWTAVPMAVGPMSSWVDTMGKKLGGLQLQKGHTFSMGQKRASVILAGVSDSIVAALLPGPTPTTPAPAPGPLLGPASTPISTSTSASNSNVTVPRRSPSTSSMTLLPPSSPRSRPEPSYSAMADWLDDDEDQESGPVLLPDSSGPARSNTGVAAVAEAVSSFDDDDDWNW